MAPRNDAFPGDHPPPPSDLRRLALPIVATRGPWYRIHRADRAPLHFGATGDSRFDDPLHEYGVLYAGNDPFCALIETFGQVTGAVDITRVALSTRRLCRITATRSLRLVDLSADGLARIGADGRLTAGNHDVAQQWSRALRTHPSAPDGLMYRARHDQSRICAAIFEQPDLGLSADDMGTLLDDALRDLLEEMLNAYGLGVAWF